MGRVVFGELEKTVDAIAVIMAGGSGTRFWPASRRACPKQYLSLAQSSQTLIEATAHRFEKLVQGGGILVVTARSQKDLVKKLLPDACILTEPIPRNTAPCIGFAATKVLQSVGDVPMVCSPADHFVEGTESFVKLFEKAIQFASNEDILISMGIRPTSPETAFGYIRVGGALSGRWDFAREVEEFVEKPDRHTAEEYLKREDYYWNSGIFVWRPSVILRAIDELLPPLGERLKRIGNLFGSPDELEMMEPLFAEIEPISVDYGIMEKASNVAMIPGDAFQWSDIGSWTTWAECLAKSESGDKKGNLVRGDTILIDSEDSVVVANSRLVAGIGLKEVIVVETEDAVLVCHRDRAQDVKKIVEELQRLERKDLL